MQHDRDYGYVETIKQGNSSARVFVDRVNARLKVLDCDGNFSEITDTLIDLARRAGSGKIIYFAPGAELKSLERKGFVLEGEIESFFNGDTAYGFSLFIHENRKISQYTLVENKIIEEINKGKETSSTRDGNKLPGFDGICFRAVTEDDIPGLAQMYRQVFVSYPSPLLQPEYMLYAMRNSVMFMGAFCGTKPVSAASLEIDRKNCNAELTDCATLKEYRGRGILQKLMEMLEEESKKDKLRVLYSLARAGSFGMNASLAKFGYKYRGRFLNNCHIGGRFEDMNLWVKQLRGN